MDKVFVYGTLKRGHRAHNLLKFAKFKGDCYSGPGFTMLDVNGWFPGVVKDNSDNNVYGEVYEVTEDELKELDKYEGVSNGLYVRGKVHTPYGPAHVYLYNRPHEELKVVSSGCWI